MENKAAIFRIVIVGIILTGLSSVAEPEGKNIAYKTAKQKGVIKPAEVLKLETQEKDIPKDWVELDTKYFSVSYPKCFIVEPEGEEDDLKLATDVVLKRQNNCPQFKENWNEFNWLSMRYTLRKAEKIGPESSFTIVSPVFRQKAEVNQSESYILVGLRDEYDEKSKKYTYEIRWQIIIKCKNKVFFAGFTVPSGEPSINRVSTSDYSIPEDFKEIISTFQCKK